MWSAELDRCYEGKDIRIDNWFHYPSGCRPGVLLDSRGVHGGFFGAGEVGSMAAPKGNQFWKARSSHGRKPIFASPDELGEACEEYFQWVEDNPLYESKAFAYQGVVTQESVPKMRAMTIDGLCIFLDISDECWRQYREREDFIGVVTRVEKIIYAQKFTGAAADLLNANIIARDLGLKDRTDHSSEDGTMTPKGFNDFYNETES